MALSVIGNTLDFDSGIIGSNPLGPTNRGDGMYEVWIYEKEIGHNPKFVDVKYFNYLGEAEDFVKDFNSDNELIYEPDWCTYAEDPIIIS